MLYDVLYITQYLEYVTCKYIARVKIEALNLSKLYI